MPEQPPRNYDDVMEKLDRIKSAPSTQKKKKLPRFIIFLNIFLIGVMVFHYYRGMPGNEYYSTVIIYGGIQYRFSITREGAARKFIYSLTAKNARNTAVRVPFRGNVATVSIRNDETVVSAVKLGDGVRDLFLNPGDSKAFVESTGVGAFVDFANANRDLVTPRRRTIMSSEKRHIPMSAEVRLETGEPVATVLDFKYTLD